MKKEILILSFLFFGFGVFSQNLKDTIIHIDEVKITDSKLEDKNQNLIICSETVKLNSDIISQNKTSSLSELLSKQSHVFIKSYGQGSIATASIRGAGASHTQILWNGIVLNNPMNGQSDLSLIPIYFIDQAEIFAGGSSLNNISGALGGSINLESNIKKESLYAELLQSVGSFGTYQTYTKIGGSKGKLRSSLKLFHEQSENNFKFLNTANGTGIYEIQQNAAYNKTGLLNEIFLNLSENTFLTVNTWVQNNKRNIPPIMSYLGTDRDENQEDNSFKSILTYHLKKPIYTTKISGSFISEKINYFLADNIDDETFVRINSASDAKQINLNYYSEFNLSKKLYFRTNLSLDYQKAIYFDKKTEIGYDKDRKTSELFISTRFAPSSLFQAYSLIRINNTDFKFLPVMPLVGIQFQPVKNIPLGFSGTLSRNFHNPTLNDLYWIPGGNPDLKPEEGYSSDFNANYRFKNKNGFTAKIKTTIYASVINNQIVWQPGEYGFWNAKNIKQVFSRGIEISFNTDYSFNKIQTSFSGNYSYTKSTNQSETGNNDNSYGKQLIYIPVHKANSHFDIEFLKWSFKVSETYTGKRYTNSSEEDSRFVLPAFNLIHLNFGRTFTLKKLKLETEIKINNLLNTEYQETLWRAMPGRQYLFIVKVEFLK